MVCLDQAGGDWGGTVCVKLNNRMGPYFVSHKGVR
jgi:hypothetical protein